MVSSLHKIKTVLKQAGNNDRAQHSILFFKTGKGEYAEGDKFLGCTVPSQRKIAKHYSKEFTVEQIIELLHSPWHEHRLTALFMLIDHYNRGNEKIKAAIYKYYILNTKYINNWDLVDSSAHKIVGDYLLHRSRQPLYTLAKSRNLWEKRIAIISTFAYLPHNDFKDALAIAEILLHDKHDLIHKAVGWTLREVGKRDLAAEEQFLKKHYTTMPRTMLRYAIEKFPKTKYNFYLGRAK